MSRRKGVLVVAAVAGILGASLAGCAKDKHKGEKNSCKSMEKGSCKSGGSCKSKGSCKGGSDCGKSACSK